MISNNLILSLNQINQPIGETKPIFLKWSGIVYLSLLIIFSAQEVCKSADLWSSFRFLGVAVSLQRKHI